MIKPKPKVCPYCKEEYTPFNSLNPCHLNPPCAVKWLKDNPEKAKKNYKKVVRKELNQMKEKVGNKKPDKSVLQDIVNHIARLIDRDQVCISCSRYPKAKHGGHRWAVNENQNIRYNLCAIMLQCYSCNDRKSGCIDGYDKGLLETFGQEYFDYVRYDIKRIYSYVGLSNFDLKEKIKIARSIVKELQTLDKTYTTQERIELRHKYNKQIGIYL